MEPAIPSSRSAKILGKLGITLQNTVDSWKIAPLCSEITHSRNENPCTSHFHSTRKQCVQEVFEPQEFEPGQTVQSKNEENSELQKLVSVPLKDEQNTLEKVREMRDFETSENKYVCRKSSNTPIVAEMSIEDSEGEENTGFSDDSIADPNYESDSSTSSSTSDENQPVRVLREENLQENEIKKKSRKRKRVLEGWKRNQVKFLRNSGKAYKTLNKGQNVAAQKIKPACGEKCKFNCVTKFSEEERTDIFSKYWSLANVEKQRAFISTLMQEVMRGGTSTQQIKRTNNNAFYFPKNDNKIRVCKVFFISTLGITTRCVRSVISKRKEGNFEERRGKHGNQRKIPDAKNDIRAHIASIPKIESHYVRAHTEREYIEGGKTITDLYRDYKLLCQTQGKDFASLSTYRDIFNYEFNLAFFVPKKDQCLKCVAYENADVEQKKEMENDYLTHQNEKTLSRQEKQADKDKISNCYQVSCFDLQATLPLPKGDVSTFYYKSKLSLYNFTVCDLASKGQGSVWCFVWHEGEGKRGPNEIGSCLLHYLKRRHEEYKGNDLEIVFYSDNCSGQQKNKFVLAAYFYALANYSKIKSITHKYLVSGHTQNEGDNVHSLIEKNIKRVLKSGTIETPDQYVMLIQTAKKTGEPYRVVEMNYKDFFDIKKLTLQTCFNFSKDSSGENVRFSDGCVFKVERDNLEEFYYKTSFTDSKYKTVSIKPRKNTRTNNTPTFQNISLDCAYKSPLPISKKKHEDLMDLLRSNAIKTRNAHFYMSLKASKD